MRKPVLTRGGHEIEKFNSMIYNTTIYFFLGFAVLIFIKFLFYGDTNDKKLQKIFGSLLILIAAILSNNGLAISISIFVSGLIVASEDFMRFLAAVLKTSGDKVADTVKALRASSEEIEKKVEKESKELDIRVFEDVTVDEVISPTTSDTTSLKIGPATSDEPIKTSSDQVRERTEKIKKIEELIQPYLIKKFAQQYEAHMKITKGAKSLIVDGILKRRSGKIWGIVEIRYITEKSFPNLKYLIIKFREKLVQLGIKKRILMLVVSEEINSNNASQMFEENKGLANLWFFKLSDNHLELIEPSHPEMPKSNR